MNVEAYIQQLGVALGLPELTLGKKNACRVILDGNILDFEKIPDTDEIFVMGVVCSLPTVGREALFYRLLAGNHMGLESGDAALSIDPYREEILIYRKININNMEYAEFERIVTALYARQLHWQEVCALCLADAPAPPKNENSIEMGDMLRV